jgi:cyanophycinase
MGGGYDEVPSWVDSAFSWFVQAADSGKIINIDTDPAAQGYADDFITLGADLSSHPLQIPNSATANDSSIYYELISAKGIFIEGGDQYDYVKNWKDTLVEDAIHYVFQHGGVIGGTSAGLAVLGSVCFDAKYDSAYPEEVAYDPYDPHVHFEDDFLQILPSVLTDSHFHPRGRLGRLVPMLARLIQDNNEDLMGIGLDEKTAMCIDPNFSGKVYGEGSVTILYKSPDSKIVCEAQAPITFTNIHCEQLVQGVEYSLATRSLINPGPIEPIHFDPETITYSDTTINGSDPDAVNIGDVVISRLTSNENMAWFGHLQQDAGLGKVPNCVIISQLWNDKNFFENRIIGGLWGAVTNLPCTAIYLDDGSMVSVNTAGMLQVEAGITYIFETNEITYCGFKQPVVSNHPGIIGGKLHFLRTGDKFNLTTHQVISTIKSESKQIPQNFQIYQNYPNPFNPGTMLSFELDQPGSVNLSVLNSQGRQIETIVQEFCNSGLHSIYWDNPRLSSGIYFFQLQVGTVSKSISSLLLK